MLVTLLVKFRNSNCKTTELGLLLQVLPVRIATFVKTLGSHLKCRNICHGPKMAERRVIQSIIYKTISYNLA